ncbi:Lateral signaling target protein 2-like protein [Diplonema papillatum]|nr:Lateral signaling target protein 2-like protein [Diplonema papillatum]|eukprot:gene6609-10114_t
MSLFASTIPLERSDDPMEGLEGPTLQLEMYKKSDMIREWRSRFIAVQNRRLYYYEVPGDAQATAGKPLGAYKGWLDLTGAKIQPFEEESEEDGLLYCVTVTEEYSSTGLGAERAEPAKYELGVSEKETRDSLVHTLKYAARPRWVSDSYSGQCMESKRDFNFFERRHHCRRCGGLFLGDVMMEQTLPDLHYDTEVLVCVPCSTGTKRASRWMTKTPNSERCLKTDAVTLATAQFVNSTRKTLTAVGDMLKHLSADM